MDRDQRTPRSRISTLTALVLGFALGLIAVWIYWVQRRGEARIVKKEEGTRLEVQVLPADRESGPDDLTQIEGIGPKIASVLRSAGISTYEALAGSTATDLRAMLREEGLYFTDPTTWPEQAQLAAVGAWGALSDLQEGLTAGRRL